MAGQICPIFERKDGDNLSLIGAWMLNPVNLKIVPDSANFMEIGHVGPMLSSYLRNEPCHQVPNKEVNVGNGVVFQGGAFIMGNDNKAPNEQGGIPNVDCSYILKSNNGVAILIREMLSSKNEKPITQSYVNLRTKILPAINRKGDGDVASIEKIAIENPKALFETDKDGWNAFFHAAYEGKTKCLQAMINSDPSGLTTIDPVGQTPAHPSAREGHTECIKLILSANPEVFFMKDNRGCTPSWYAARNGNTNTVKAIAEVLPKSFSTIDNNKRTPVSLVAYYKHFECFSIIANAFPDALSIKDIDGKLPIHYLAEWGDLAYMKIIKDLAPQTFLIATDTGETPMDYARKKNFTNSIVLIQQVVDSLPKTKTKINSRETKSTTSDSKESKVSLNNTQQPNTPLEAIMKRNKNWWQFWN